MPRLTEDEQLVHQAAKDGNISQLQNLLDNGHKLDAKDEDGVQPIHLAAEAGKLDVVKFLFENGCDLQALTEDTLQPVHQAAYTGSIDVIKFLILHECKLDAVGKDGMQPIHYAADKGHLDMVKLLFENGCDLQALTKNNEQSLHYAARNGSIDVIKFLILHGCKLDAVDKDGWQPIHFAADKDHLDMVKFLFENGCDLQAMTKKNEQSVHYAAHNGSIDIIKFLILQGCKLDAIDKDGGQPIHFAASTGQLDMVKFLFENGCDLQALTKDGRQPIHWAADKGHLDMVKLLFENGCDLQALRKDGWQPIHSAADEGHLDMVKFLFDNGCDLQALTKDALQPVHDAARNGSIDIIKFLILHGCKLDAVDKDGWQPIHWAVDKGHLDMVKFLFENGCDLQALRKDALQPVHDAARNGSIDIIKFLILHGCKLDAVDKNGWQPIHWAVDKGQLDMVQFLFENGCDLQALSKNNVQPVHFAARNGSIDVIKFLIQHGCKLDAVDKYGVQPIHFAAKHAQVNMVKFLCDKGCTPQSKTKKGNTPMTMTKSTTVKYILKEYQYNLLMKEPGVSTDVMKLHICGYGGVGKTTLKETLQRGWWQAKITKRNKETPPPPRQDDYVLTPGIDVSSADLPGVGKMCVLDYAGQSEFYITHSMFLGARNAVFAIVFEIIRTVADRRMKSQYMADKQKNEVFTWLRYIKAAYEASEEDDIAMSEEIKSEISKPTIILVASRADMIKPEYKEEAECVIREFQQEAKEMFSKYLNIVDETYLLNCHDSRSEALRRLRERLRSIKKRKTIPKLCAKIMEKRKTLFDGSMFPVLYWNMYLQWVKEIDPLLDEAFLRQATSYLDDMGEIIYIHSTCASDDVVVLEPQWLCSRIFGPMLASEMFVQYTTRLPRKKFYSMEDIDSVFGEQADTNLLVHLLETFQLLFEVPRDPVGTDKIREFIIPGLLEDTMPPDQWQKSDVHYIYRGRRIQCHDETDSFSAGFFPRLQTRLNNTFTEAGHPPSGIWKNGIRVTQAVEALVYLTKDRTAALICVRATTEADLGKCQQLLDSITKDVDDMLQITSPGTSVDQCILSDQSLRNHSTQEDIRYYTVEAVIEAEEREDDVYDATSGKVESITNLLCQGYDKTFLIRKGYNCDVKWMLNQQRELFTMSMDIERPDVNTYAYMAQLMGIGYKDVRGFEAIAGRAREPVTGYILVEWSKRCAERKRSELSTEGDGVKGGLAKQETEFQVRGETIYLESTFENLLKILERMKRHDCIQIIRNMFKDVTSMSRRPGFQRLLGFDKLAQVDDDDDDDDDDNM
ncbi:uncharacterized protein LOC144450164 isoform X2 [Glandiceps talaboti]